LSDQPIPLRCSWRIKENPEIPQLLRCVRMTAPE
jgi:hypothetical protein